VARTSKKPKSPSPRRSTRTLERLANVVPHPRYGTAIVPSGLVGEDDVIPGPPEWSKDVTAHEASGCVAAWKRRIVFQLAARARATRRAVESELPVLRLRLFAAFSGQFERSLHTVHIFV
jgi:hypothetical protein